MKKISVVLVLIAGTLWGIIGLFVRELTSHGLDSLQIVAVRMTISAVIFSLFILIYNRHLFYIKLKDLWCFLGTGVISVASFSYFYFRAIQLSSLSVAAILLYTAPAFVMLFSLILFREKLSSKKTISLVLAFLGCVLVTGVLGDTASVSFAGIMFGISSGLCYALYSIFSRYALSRGYDPLTIILYTFVFSGLSVSLIVDKKPVIDEITASVPSLIYCIVFALVSGVVPYLTYTVALKHLKSSTASIIASVEPVVATIMGVALFSEQVDFPLGYIGIALVIGSIIILNFQKRKLKNDK